MGIWEFISSTAEAVKRNAPDATPVKNVCTTAYTSGAAAITKTAEVVAPPVKNASTNAYAYGAAAVTKIRELTPDDETKSKIGMYTTKFAKNAGIYALKEGYKLIPGGVAVSKIISQTVNDVQNENQKLQKLELSEKKAASPQKHLSVGAAALSKGSLVSDHKSPEDVIRVFMMEEFIGSPFFDDLMVHELARKKVKKPE